jgi:hypothetical protein
LRRRWRPGHAAGLAPELFQEIAGKGLRFDAASGQHRWFDAPSQAPRRHVLPLAGADTLAGVIEPLMVEGATAPG